MSFERRSGGASKLCRQTEERNVGLLKILRGDTNGVGEDEVTVQGLM